MYESDTQVKTTDGITFNLQKFSETSPPPTMTSVLDSMYDAKVAEEAPTTPTEPPPEPTPPADVPEQTPVAPPPVAVTSTKQSPSGNLLAGKYKTPEDLVSGYQNLNAVYSRTMQENHQLKQALAQAQQPPPVTETPPAEEPVAITQEEFMEKFYEDPVSAVNLLAEQVARQTEERLMKQFQPINERYTTEQKRDMWATEIERYGLDHPDLEEQLPVMTEYIQQRGLRDTANPAMALEDAYLHARGLQYKDPDSLLQDESFISKIMGNENIRNRIISDQIAVTKQVNSGVPRHLTNTGGAAPLLPDRKPTTMEGAAQLLDELLSRHQK